MPLIDVCLQTTPALLGRFGGSPWWYLWDYSDMSSWWAILGHNPRCFGLGIQRCLVLVLPHSLPGLMCGLGHSGVSDHRRAFFSFCRIGDISLCFRGDGSRRGCHASHHLLLTIDLHIRALRRRNSYRTGRQGRIPRGGGHAPSHSYSKLMHRSDTWHAGTWYSTAFDVPRTEATAVIRRKTEIIIEEVASLRRWYLITRFLLFPFFWWGNTGRLYLIWLFFIHRRDIHFSETV